MTAIDIILDQPVRQEFSQEFLEIAEEILKDPAHFVLGFLAFAGFMAVLIFTFAAWGAAI